MVTVSISDAATIRSELVQRDLAITIEHDYRPAKMRADGALGSWFCSVLIRERIDDGWGRKPVLASATVWDSDRDAPCSEDPCERERLATVMAASIALRVLTMA